MKKRLSLLSLPLLIVILSSCASTQCDKPQQTLHQRLGYLIVTEHGVVADGKTDVSDAIQKLIDENPQRTLFFPDGTYMLSKPILTPADPKLSVCLHLSAYAVLKADKTWTSKEAVVRLGAKHPKNNITTIGSNYYIQGGFIDGSNVANGISIDGGRETAIRHINIKHAHIGIHIKRGANSGSSDADVNNVNIIGSGRVGSTGVLIEGYDNTLTNMRIASVQIGFHAKSGGNSFRNIHPLFTYNREIGSEEAYQNSIGFFDENGGNFYNYCYSDQFNTGFKISYNGSAVFTDCFVFWYGTRHCKNNIAFHSVKRFNSVVKNLKVGFRDKVKNTLLKVDVEGGKGFLAYPIVSEKRLHDHSYKKYLVGHIVPIY